MKYNIELLSEIKTNLVEITKIIDKADTWLEVINKLSNEYMEEFLVLNKDINNLMIKEVTVNIPTTEELKLLMLKNVENATIRTDTFNHEEMELITSELFRNKDMYVDIEGNTNNKTRIKNLIHNTLKLTLTEESNNWIKSIGLDNKRYIRSISELYFNNIDSRILDSITRTNYLDQPNSSKYSKGILNINSNNVLNTKHMSKYREDQEIVNIYWENYPIIKDIIDFIILIKNGANKKKSYISLQAPSDWGKSFIFQGVLRDALGMVAEFNSNTLTTAVNGGASSFTATEFDDKWLMYDDEANGAPKALKTIVSSLSYRPLYGSNRTVDVYTKLLVSADKNENLISNDGVMEDQFKNRFCIMEVPKDTAPEFKKVFANYSDQQVKEAMALEISNYILKGTAELQALTLTERELICNEEINIIYEKYNSNVTSNLATDLNNKIPVIIQEILHERMVNYDKYNELHQSLYRIEGTEQFLLKNKRPWKNEILIRLGITERNEIRKIEKSSFGFGMGFRTTKQVEIYKVNSHTTYSANLTGYTISGEDDV